MTPEEHDLLSRMDERLAFIQDKVVSFCAFKDAAAIDIANLKGHCATHNDLPERISNLEKWRWLLTGGFSVVCLLMCWNWIVIGGAK